MSEVVRIYLLHRSRRRFMSPRDFYDIVVLTHQPCRKVLKTLIRGRASGSVVLEMDLRTCADRQVNRLSPIVPEGFCLLKRARLASSSNLAYPVLDRSPDGQGLSSRARFNKQKPCGTISESMLDQRSAPVRRSIYRTTEPEARCREMVTRDYFVRLGVHEYDVVKVAGGASIDIGNDVIGIYEQLRSYKPIAKPNT